MHSPEPDEDLPAPRFHRCRTTNGGGAITQFFKAPPPRDPNLVYLDDDISDSMQASCHGTPAAQAVALGGFESRSSCSVGVKRGSRRTAHVNDHVGQRVGCSNDHVPQQVVPKRDAAAVAQRSRASEMYDKRQQARQPLSGWKHRPLEHDLDTHLLSLDKMVCRSADGGLYMMELDDIHTLLLKKSLGDIVMAPDFDKHQEKLMRLNSFEYTSGRMATAAPSAASLLHPSRRRPLGINEAMLTPRTAQAVNGDLAGDDPLSPRAAPDPAIEEEVRRHMARTDAKIASFRSQLMRAANSRRDKDKDGPAEANRGQVVLKPGSKWRIVQRVGNWGSESRTTQSGSGAADSTIATDDAASTAATGEDVDAGSNNAQSRSASPWRKVQAVVDRNIRAWHQQDLRAGGTARARMAPSWNHAIPLGDMYVKKCNKYNGTAVYEFCCNQLGAAPSTQVIHQLTATQSNMAHCKLGRPGALALGSALAANTAIMDLDLTDNALDHRALSDILRGIAVATGAKLAPKTRNLTTQGPKLEALLPGGVGGAGGGGTASGCASPSPYRRSSMDGVHTTPTPDGSSSQEQDFRHGSQVASQYSSQHVSPRSRSALGAPAASFPAGDRLMAQLYSQLNVLNLSENPLGTHGAALMAEMLDPTRTPHQFLTSLTLNKCEITEAGGIALVKALGNSNLKLRKLSMTHNRLGNKAAAAFGDLLESNHTLRELNLAWNQIKGEGAKIMARGLQANSTLSFLNLSWNGLDNEGASAMGDMLTANMGLKTLDLAHARIGPAGCLLLAEGLKANSVLEVLLLNGNSVGEDGARHLMNALNSNKSIQFLGLQGTNMSSAAREEDGSPAHFNPASADGSYCLDLAILAERAVALQLCELDQASPADLMKNIRVDGKTFSSCKRAGWPPSLPTHGTLLCEFSSKRQCRTLRVPDQKKFMSLLKQFYSTTMADKERLSLVNMFTPFTYLLCSQIATVLKTFGTGPEKPVAAAVMYARASDADEHLLEVLQPLSEREQHCFTELLGWYAHTRFSNPTGHYVFNLTLPLHRAMANRLKDVAFSEPEAPLWINIIYDQYTSTEKVAASYGPIDAWKSMVPTSGILTFDYVTHAPDSGQQQELTDEQLKSLLIDKVGINSSMVPTSSFEEANQQIGQLRQQSIYMRVSANQMKDVIGCFQESPHRVEALIILYACLVNKDQLWTVLYALNGLEQALAILRLGPANVYNPKHCSLHWVLDLNDPSHEEVAKKMVAATAKDSSDVPNFYNFRLNGSKHTMTENANMWGTLTAETFTPHLEFDFIGSDGWAALGRSDKDVAAMGVGDKLELRTKQAAKLELVRSRQLQPYFEDGSGWARPSWQGWASLMKPLLDKGTWVACWDRMLRTLVRYEQRSGDLEYGSPLQDLYTAYASGGGEGGPQLMAGDLEQMLKDHGYSKSEVAAYTKAIELCVAGRVKDKAPPSAPPSKEQAGSSAGMSRAQSNDAAALEAQESAAAVVAAAAAAAAATAAAAAVAAALTAAAAATTSLSPKTGSPAETLVRSGDAVQGAPTSKPPLRRTKTTVTAASVGGSDPPPACGLTYGEFVSIVMRPPRRPCA